MSKEKVLLVNLPFPFNRYSIIDREVSGSSDYAEHLGLETLASVLRENNISVKIIDAFSKRLSVQNVIDEVISGDYLVVGFSLFDFSVNILGELCDKIKSLKKDVHITSGGHWITNTYNEILNRFHNLDSVIRGEGELTLLELCKKVIQGEEWRNVNGLAYREDNKVYLNPKRPLIDNLDEMPFPSRDFIEERINEGKSIDTVHLYTSRGCYGTCNFCDIKAFYGDQKGYIWRARTAKNVVDEIEYLQKKYNLSIFSIYDDNFIGIGQKGKLRAKEIANEIIRRELKISFYISCRVDDVEPELFKLLKKAGLYCVFLGVENFSQPELDYFNKLVNYEYSCKAIEFLRSIDVVTALGHIAFTPSTRLKDISTNIKFLEKYDGMSFFKGTFLQRYPGTAFYSIPDIFKKEYNVFDYSEFRKLEFYIVDSKVDKLAYIIQKDNWFIRTFAVHSHCIRNHYKRPWAKRFELLHYLYCINYVQKLNFEISTHYLRELITILENTDENRIERMTETIRCIWKHNNDLIRKYLLQVRKFIKSGDGILWKYELHPSVIISFENGNYRYKNTTDNTFVLLSKRNHEVLEQIFKADYINNDYIETNLNLKLEDFYRFLQYLLEINIVKLQDINITIWMSVLELYQVPKQSICWNIEEEVNVNYKKAIQHLVLNGNKHLMLICNHINQNVQNFTDQIGNKMQYVGLQMKLEESNSCLQFVEKVDQFIFTLSINDLEERLCEINEIYEKLRYKMPYDTIFAIKGLKKDQLAYLVTIQLPFKIYILADKTGYSTNKEVSELISYIQRYIDKLPNIELIYSDLRKVVTYEMDKKTIYFSLA